MISCINLFRKDPSLDDGKFDAFLDETYAPLCLQIPGMESFEVDRVTLKEQGDASSDAITADAPISRPSRPTPTPPCCANARTRWRTTRPMYVWKTCPFR